MHLTFCHLEKKKSQIVAPLIKIVAFSVKKIWGSFWRFLAQKVALPNSKLLATLALFQRIFLNFLTEILEFWGILGPEKSRGQDLGIFTIFTTFMAGQNYWGECPPLTLSLLRRWPKSITRVKTVNFEPFFEVLNIPDDFENFVLLKHFTRNVQGKIFGINHTLNKV